MDPTYRRRIFKVSKELDRLALMCEQHKLQVAHRRGLPDWTLPAVPAGIPTSEHERVPTFFAWERADTQSVHAPRIEAADRSTSVQYDPASMAAQATPTHSALSTDERSVPSSAWQISTPVHPIATPSEPVSPPPRSISAAPYVSNTPAFSLPVESPSEQAMTPMRQPAIDLTTPFRAEEPTVMPTTPASGMITPERPTRRTPPPPVQVPTGNSSTTLLLSPSSTVPSPRYKHGRRLREIDLARPSSADSYRSTPAGISTVAADRFKKRPSFRSPDWALRRPNKRLAFLDSQVRLAEEEHKNADRAAASRSASPSDHQWNNRSAQSLNERRRYVLSGSDALRVANSAAREFLHEYPQENTVANSQQVEGVQMGPVVITSESPRKNKPASVDEAVQVDLDLPKKSTVRVVDRTTQTEQIEVQPAVEAVEAVTPTIESVHPNATTTSTRSSKAPRTIASSSASPQLMNPILMNRRYPPEPSAFRAQTSYRLDFGDKRASR